MRLAFPALRSFPEAAGAVSDYAEESGSALAGEQTIKRGTVAKREGK
jgi:hypothetical protein